MLDKQNIEGLYPLALLQKMFWLNSLQTSSSSGLLHVRCKLQGQLDRSQLQQAWKIVSNRHQALRTSVHWEGVKKPIQAVWRQVAVTMQCLDWRGQRQIQQCLSDWLDSDRNLGLELTRAPIARLTLIQITDIEYELIWTTHHLILDGWSSMLVINQVFDCYIELVQGKPQTLPLGPSYKNYIRWLKQQDIKQAEIFWGNLLQGFNHPLQFSTPVKNSKFSQHSQDQFRASSVSNNHPIEAAITLTPKTWKKLQEYLKSQHLTLSSLIYGAWALLLHLSSQQTDLIFGMTVSGRQGGLIDSEAIVGMLMNVVPLRVHIPISQPAASWLQDLQAQQLKAQQYAYASPSQIQAWSRCPKQLFNSLIVIENYPTPHQDRTRALQECGLQISEPHSGVVSAYQLTVIAKPSKNGITLSLRSTLPQLEQKHVQATICYVSGLIEQLVNKPEIVIETLADQLSNAEFTQALKLLCSEEDSSPSPLSVKPPVALAPRNAIEHQLVEIWQSLLGVSPIGVTDNFFSLGGNSLAAAALFLQIKEHCLVDLPLVTLFQAPTVERLALRLLEQLSQEHQPELATATQPQSQALKPEQQSLQHASTEPATQLKTNGQNHLLVSLQPEGEKPPLFFLPGGSGGVDEEWVTYARLLHPLGPSQPVYGLRTKGLKAGNDCHISVEEMARDCLSAIRSVQPLGPYFLGGECIGGLVAYEIAQQLIEQGEKVDFLALLDTDPELCRRQAMWLGILNALLISRTLSYFESLSDLTLGEKLKRIGAKFRSVVSIGKLWRPRHQLAQPKQKNGRDTQVKLPPQPLSTKIISKVALRYKQMACCYQLKPYKGPVILLSSSDLRQYPNKPKKWSALALGGLSLHPLDSTHEAYLRENYQSTARVLAKLLIHAQKNIDLDREPSNLSSSSSIVR